MELVSKGGGSWLGEQFGKDRCLDQFAFEAMGTSTCRRLGLYKLREVRSQGRVSRSKKYQHAGDMLMPLWMPCKGRDRDLRGQNEKQELVNLDEIHLRSPLRARGTSYSSLQGKHQAP